MFRGIPSTPGDGPWAAYGSGGGYESDEESDVTAAGTSQPRSALPPRAASPSKRKRPAAEDEEMDDDFDSDDVREVVEMSDRGQRSSQPHPGDGPVTPTGAHTRANSGGLPTPASRNSRLIASEPGPKRVKTAEGTAAVTPTPTRTRNALQAASQPQGDGVEDDAEVTVAVMGMLKTQPVQEPVRRAVRETLNLFALRARGVERSRDLLREALTRRDQRIAELQARVVTLENERRAKKEMVRKALSDLEALYQEGGED
ncbi:hypothetical protein VTK56DRAFT_2454 [Thermocarpiscus australiensis]